MPSVGYYRTHDAALTASGLVLADGSTNPIPGCGLRLATHNGPRPARRVEGPTVLFDERLETSPGHWLLEVRYRLSTLLQCGFDLRSLRYLASPTLTSLIGEVLLNFGIGEPRPSTYNPEQGSLRIADLIMPTSLCLQGYTSPVSRELSFLRHGGIDEPEPEICKDTRIFMVPSPGHEGRPRNVAELIEIGEQLGYRTPDLDRRSPHEQQQLLASASALVTCGDQGSGWSLRKPGAVVCSLRSSECHSGYVQSSIAHVLEQHVGYVFGAGEAKDTMKEDFYIDPDDFESALKIVELYKRA